jgi:hypothetical protein
MAIIIRGKSKCLLCNQILEEGDPLTAFPAFLPADHRFGKFSDAAFHTTCFDKDPDANDVENMRYVWEKIMKTMPRDLVTEEQRNAWYAENFQDWPPKNGVIVYEQCFTDDGQEAEWFWADKDSWAEFEAAEDAANKEREERRKEAYRREREAWRYVRDDDY